MSKLLPFIFFLLLSGLFTGSPKQVFSQHEQRLIKEAEKQLNHQDWDAAFVLFERALQQNPQNLSAVLGLAECKANMGDLRKTIIYCNIASDIIENYKERYKNLQPDSTLSAERIEETLLQLRKKEASVYHLKGKAKSKLHKYDDSYEFLKKAAELDSANNDIWIDLGILKYQQGKIVEAEYFFEYGLKINSKNYKASFNLGNIHYEKGDLDKAAEYYQYTVSVKPDFKAAWLHLGDIFLTQKSARAAIDAFSELIDHGQHLEEAYFKRASAYNLIGFYENALADWSKAYNLNPSNYDARRNRGLMQMVIKNYDQAEEDFTWLIENNENELYAYLNRAYTYLLNNKKKKALKDVNKAIEKKPDYAQAYYHRSLIYAFKNRKRKTCKDYKQALSLGFNEAETEEIILKTCKNKK